MVYLIGAGPGDEELLTIKAKRALEKCTAVLYDRLVNPNILRHLTEDCQIYYCGKEPGCHNRTQEDINNLMVSLAKAGHIVGRIKGGDPYVFGRGGEEALRLCEEGIQFEVIPGITSPIAALNYAGIPITHRAIAQSFHVFTGQSAEELHINWEAAATSQGTLLFLMGLGNIETIIAHLLHNGKKANSPCAVIMKGTTAKQKIITGTIENICEKVKTTGLKPPCIIAIGEVVAFSEKLNWFKKKPLQGYNICITRSKEQSKPLRERLLDLGAAVTEINTIKLINTSQVLDDYLKKLPTYDYITFTSVNGVRFFFEFLKNRCYDIRNIKANFAVIGPATAEALQDRGIIPNIIAEEFVAESLFDQMKGELQQGDRVLVPRSKQARPYLVEQLREHGCFVDEVHIYEVGKGELRDKRSLTDVDLVIFTSPTTVRNLLAMIGLEKIQQKQCIAIGPITNDELTKNGIDAIVCDEYSVDGIIKKLLGLRMQEENDDV